MNWWRRGLVIVRVDRRDCSGGSIFCIDNSVEGCCEYREVLRDTVCEEMEEMVHGNVKGAMRGLREGHVDGERRVHQVFHEGFVAKEFGVGCKVEVRRLGFKVEGHSGCVQ